MPAVLAVERQRPARIGTGATVLLDELLHDHEGAVLAELLLLEVQEPWLVGLRGDDEDVQRSDVLERGEGLRLGRIGLGVLHRPDVGHGCTGQDAQGESEIVRQDAQDAHKGPGWENVWRGSKAERSVAHLRIVTEQHPAARSTS